MTQEEINELQSQYPFLTVGRYGEEEYIGIVQNQDNSIISIFIYDEIKEADMRRQFLEYGAKWWWETNRLIPINIILGEKFHPYQNCLRSFNMREFNIIAGPVVCLKNIVKTKGRRKNIKLIRKMD